MTKPCTARDEVPVIRTLTDVVDHRRHDAKRMARQPAQVLPVP